MIVKEDGPFDLISKFRRFVGVFEDDDGLATIQGYPFASFFVCPLCLSMWIAIPFTLLLGGSFLEYLAISGGARLLLRFSEK